MKSRRFKFLLATTKKIPIKPGSLALAAPHSNMVAFKTLASKKSNRQPFSDVIHTRVFYPVKRILKELGIVKFLLIILTAIGMVALFVYLGMLLVF